jgi:hypothetical protein
VRDLAPRTITGDSECHDLGLYFHLATNNGGKKVALIYKPSIAERPQASEMRRQSVLARFRELGIAIVGLDRDEFLNLAANAISPEPGTILLNMDVSPSLKEPLKANGLNPVIPEQAIGNARTPSCRSSACIASRPRSCSRTSSTRGGMRCNPEAHTPW